MALASVRGTPVPEPGPRHTVVQLKAGDVLHCVMLSPSIWGVGTHWNENIGKKGRSERCTGNSDTCNGCALKLPCRWKGYLYVHCFKRGRPVFVELTPFTAKTITMQAKANEPLRGQRLTLKRGEGGDKTRLDVMVEEYHGNKATLPEDLDPEPILEILWNWRR